MWLWLAAVASGVTCLYVYGRYSLAAVARAWEFVLTPAGQRALTALKEQVALDAAMLDYAYHTAAKAQRAARQDEAIRLLELAFSVVKRATPDRLTRLRAMSVLCRMAAAILPPPPLRPRAFRLRQLTTWAGLGVLCHHVLVSGLERFRLRLCLLRFGFRLVLEVMGRSASRVRLVPGAVPAWQGFAAARDDFKTLDLEHVESFRALMEALEAEERISAVP